MITAMDKRPDKARANLLRRVWLLTSDDKTTQAVRGALQADHGFNVCGVCAELPELAAALEQEPTPAAVVDIDAQPARMLRDLEPIITRFSQTRFVVVCSSFSNDLILDAMEAGARHFVPKQAIGADLAPVLRRLTPGAAVSRDEHRGALITVLSAGGGCGATTFAVNLANELHLQSHSPSLIVDLDAAYGAVATYLGLSGDYGVGDVLSRQGGVDPQLIRSTVVAYSEGLHALLSPATVDLSRPAPPTAGRIEEVLNACSRAYAYTVVDAPRAPVDVALRLASESSITYIVGQLSVKDIRMARAIRTFLVEGGVPAQSVRFIAGRYTRHSALSLEDVERGLGGAELDVVHNDYKAASHSTNVGELLSKAAPRSALRCDIHRLATELHKKFQPALPSFQGHIVAG